MKGLSFALSLLASVLIGCFGLLATPQVTSAASFEGQPVKILAVESSLSSLENKSLCTLDGQKIDLNNANLIAFTDCPGFYPTLAKSIVINGPYQNVEDVLTIPELSDRQKERLVANLDRFMVSDPAVPLERRMPPRPAMRK